MPASRFRCWSCPGAAQLHDPSERDPADVEDDLAEGLISAEGAREYGYGAGGEASGG